MSFKGVIPSPLPAKAALPSPVLTYLSDPAGTTPAQHAGA